ncbi:inositol-1-monophosphatase [Bacillus sp. JCM 19046]|nr:inositol-1-monophosphatase [Bacillus sp. JCM 19045]GAF16519.1 inositol-1-monophosphatase [Bacillus sp. JCM 19046]
MEPNWIEIEKQAKTWLVEAGNKIKKALEQPFTIDAKSGPDDLVTDVDKSTEAYFYQQISSTYPTHHFLGEEGVAKELTSLSGTVWIIDPIDGTMNFVHQQQNFAISMGVFQDGVGKLGFVYDVIKNELFHAVQGEGLFVNDKKVVSVKERPLEEAIIGLNANWLVENHPLQTNLIELVQSCRGTRSYGSAALEMAYVATDRMDAYISLNLSPWDYAGGAILLNEVNCLASRFDGSTLSLLDKGTMVCSKSNLHQTLVDRLQKGASE